VEERIGLKRVDLTLGVDSGDIGGEDRTEEGGLN
jgi:hypothetical protein